MTPSKNKSKGIPIDLDQVMERVGQDRDFLFDLLKIYREEFTEKLKSLEQSIAERKYNSIQELGHYLKGSSANLGLIDLQKVSFSMECAGKEKDIKKAQKALKNLNKEFDILNKYITEEMKG
ncbi:MAG: Hpt domain-containing protein [Acidobacteriota bacterium]